MWLGLKCKGRIRAILASLALVLFVPWVIKLMIVAAASVSFGPGMATNSWSVVDLRTLQTMATLVPGVLVDLSVIIWASSRLPQNFRQLALRPQRENPA
jgi:hypothetical protein